MYLYLDIWPRDGIGSLSNYVIMGHYVITYCHLWSDQHYDFQIVTQNNLLVGYLKMTSAAKYFVSHNIIQEYGFNSVSG